MARARKLFPIYGSTLANSMLVTLVHDRVVAGFVSAYVARHDRPGILGGPARDRELAETVGREILLAMIIVVGDALPAFFGRRQKSKLRSEEKAAVDAFFVELLSALERAKNWNPEDRQEFRRDLGLYSEFSARQETAAKTRKGKKVRKEEAPFVARVALLLDPSMLELSRRAARKFYGDVEKLAQKLLKKTLG
jgi:hypothetical protein